MRAKSTRIYPPHYCYVLWFSKEKKRFWFLLPADPWKQTTSGRVCEWISACEPAALSFFPLTQRLLNFCECVCVFVTALLLSCLCNDRSLRLGSARPALRCPPRSGQSCWADHCSNCLLFHSLSASLKPPVSTWRCCVSAWDVSAKQWRSECHSLTSGRGLAGLSPSRDCDESFSKL